MIDPRHIWNVIYNARHNRCHPPTSANSAPATQNDSHYCPWSHMKRYLQCAEQQVASSNITEYCACYAKLLSRVILVTYETLFTMRQHHQILRLPRKMTVMTDPRHIWNVIYNARNKRWHPPTSPNTAPATQIDSWTSPNAAQWLILVTYETSFTMRGATEVFLQHHRILRLPHKMTLMIDPHDTWNIIYNARSNRCVSPTSPNTAPATQNDSHDWSAWHMKHHLQCAE